MMKSNKVREFRDIKVDENAVLRHERKQFKAQFQSMPRKSPVGPRRYQTPLEETVEFEEENSTNVRKPTMNHDKTTSMEPQSSQNEEGEVEVSSDSESQHDEIEALEERNFCDVHSDNILDTDRRGNKVNYLSEAYSMEFWTSAVTLDSEKIQVNMLTTHNELKPPRSWKEVEHRSDSKLWKEAYQKEVTSLETVAGMMVVDFPRGKEVLELLEIFSWKENTYTGKREAKVRMAGRGDKAQIKLSLYSPVGGATGMRILIHTAVCYFDSSLQASDVRIAFLNTRTEVARYFHLPEGHKDKQGRRKVWKTFCALYGLAEASFYWYQCLTQYLKKVGLTACTSEECLFMKKDESGKLKLLVLIYVDDLLFTGTKEALTQFCIQLEERFKIRKTLEVSSYIGVEIMKTTTGFKLFQEKFIIEAVEKFELSDAKSVSTPIDISCLENFQSKKLEDKRLYQSLIGTVNYVTCCTRPDIAFAVNLLARRLQDPTYADLKRAKRILIYLRDTRKKGINIEKEDISKKVRIRTFVDASLGHGLKKKSIFGYIVMIGENIVAYKSKKQELVAQSTCEAEYVALAYSIKETLWIERLLLEIGTGFKTSIVCCDSAGAKSRQDGHAIWI